MPLNSISGFRAVVWETKTKLRSEGDILQLLTPFDHFLAAFPSQNRKQKSAPFSIFLTLSPDHSENLTLITFSQNPEIVNQECFISKIKAKIMFIIFTPTIIGLNIMEGGEWSQWGPFFYF